MLESQSRPAKRARSSGDGTATGASMSSSRSVKGKQRARLEDQAEFAFDDGDDDRSHALKQLEALGQSFMSSFDLPSASATKPKKVKSKKKAAVADAAGSPLSTKPPAIDDELEAALSGAHPLKASASAPPQKKAKRKPEPEVVVFDGAAGSSQVVAEPVSRKEFMSSKISRLTESGDAKPSAKRKAAKGGSDDEDEAEERKNDSNDRLLSQLLSTTLFAPGSRVGEDGAGGDGKRGKPSAASTATIARIMELTTPESKRGGSAVGRGWGELAQRTAQEGRAPTHVQRGLERARKERAKREVEREKELGIFRPELKRGEAGAGAGGGSRPKDRLRGMRMGVGTFKDGALRLSKHEIERVQNKGKGRGKRK